MNVGFFTGFTISGIFEQTGNYHLLFMLSGFGNLMALFLVLFNWHLLKDRNTPLSKLAKEPKRKRQILGVTLVLCMVPCLLLLINYAQFANRFILTVGALMIATLFFLAFKQSARAQTKKNVGFYYFNDGFTRFFGLYIKWLPWGLPYLLNIM